MPTLEHKCLFYNGGKCGKYIIGSGQIPSGGTLSTAGLSEELVCGQPATVTKPDEIKCDQRQLSTFIVSPVQTGTQP